MAIYVEKSPLADEPMQDDVPMQHGRDAAAAMAVVVSKPSLITPRTQPRAWNAQVDPKASSLRRVEHVPAVADARWTPFVGTMMPVHCRSMPFSRKRRLSELVQRPTKYLRLSTDESTKGLEKFHGRRQVEPTPEVATETQLSRPPRTLHFALPGLSSSETLQLLGELVAVRHELAWLNMTRPLDASIIPVFGWRAAVWSTPTPKGNDAVVYKSAKAFEGVGMHSIAREMWMWQGSRGFPEIGAPRLVYAISNELRIVRQQESLHGRAPHSSLWLEYVDVQRESIVMVRKELHRFKDTITGPATFSERECHGYILHPLLVPMGSQVVAGTALHSIGSFRTRNLSTSDQIRRMVADMPNHVLQWEDSFVLTPSRV